MTERSVILSTAAGLGTFTLAELLANMAITPQVVRRVWKQERGRYFREVGFRDPGSTGRRGRLWQVIDTEGLLREVAAQG